MTSFLSLFSTFFDHGTLKWCTRSKNQADEHQFRLLELNIEVMTIKLFLRLFPDSRASQDVFKKVLEAFWDYAEATFPSAFLLTQTLFLSLRP